jgi:hypothetical protein
MKTIVIAKFGGLDDEERREIKNNALDIYKFFKLFFYNGCFDLVAVKKVYGFKAVVDSLSSFLPFVKRNYSTIINFDEDSSETDEFLSEIGDLVLVEKKFNHTNGEALITAEDIERYSNLSEIFSKIIEQTVINEIDTDPHDFLEFLKDRGLLATFYKEYC